ncbi:MAG: hypothetical protein ACE37F_14645 [Nannocystaceae bacterium]|nr:hypothetical protein [bacterium]
MQTHAFLASTSARLLALGLLAPLCACPTVEETPESSSGSETDAPGTDGTDGTDDTDTDATDTDVGDASSTGDVPVELVEADIGVQVLLGNNYAIQLDELFRASFTASSGIARMRIFARYCADAACEQPLAVVQAEIEDADEDGSYVFSTASTSGMGFDRAVRIPAAPLGTSYLQLVGDTQASVEWGKGECTDVSDCPGDVDVLQVADFQVNLDLPGSAGNPPASTLEMNVDEPGATIEVEDIIYLGHLHFSGEELWTPAPADAGRLLAAVSNEDDSFRNRMALIDLADASATPGQLADDSYHLQLDGSDFPGDVCGVIDGGESLYAIGVGSAGAHVFELDGTTGQQVSDTPIAVFPPDGENYPWPCRGVHAEVGGASHLYLVQYKGAGAEDTSTPSPLYHVNLDTGATESDFTEYSEWAWRSLAINDAGTQLIAQDMSWSKNSRDNNVDFNRLVPIDLEADGSIGTIGEPTVTDVTADDTCGGQLSYPSAAKIVSLGGEDKLLIGHDFGVAVYDPDTLAKEDDLDLRTFGIVFTDFALSPDAQRLYALPVCKSVTGDSDFELPQGAGMEKADKNLVAILDVTGDALAVAQTEIDINEDGTPDNGIDMDYYRVKSYIRSFNSTLPIPPVVYTGPQMAVGESLLFVRGSGIQGNGSDVISSSGLGQTQDIGVFDLSTGDGVVFDRYMPFFDGLSSEAGTGTGIWGYDVNPGVESSVGWVHYLPAGG